MKWGAYCCRAGLEMTKGAAAVIETEATATGKTAEIDPGDYAAQRHL